MAELNSSPEKSGAKSPRKRLNARVDLTAMVDLAFLLITFFMLTTSLQKPKAFDMAMPDDGPVPANWPASRTMTIDIGKNDQILSFIGLPNAPIGEPKLTNDGNNGLGKAILEAKSQIDKTGKPMLIIIKASDHAVYNNMVNVLDEISIAGVDRHAIADIQPIDVELLKKHNAY